MITFYLDFFVNQVIATTTGRLNVYITSPYRFEPKISGNGLVTLLKLVFSSLLPKDARGCATHKTDLHPKMHITFSRSVAQNALQIFLRI